MLYENMNPLQKSIYKTIRTASMLWIFILGPIIGLMIGYTITNNDSSAFVIGIMVWIIGIGVVCVVYPIVCPEDR